MTEVAVGIAAHSTVWNGDGWRWSPCRGGSDAAAEIITTPNNSGQDDEKGGTAIGAHS